MKTLLGDVLPMVGQAWPTLLDSNAALKIKREFCVALENSLVSLGKSLDLLQKHRIGTRIAHSRKFGCNGRDGTGFLVFT